VREEARADWIPATYRLVLRQAGGEESWTLRLGDESLEADSGEGECDCFLTMERDDLLAISEGREDPVDLFYRGRIWMRGAMNLAMQLADTWIEAPDRADG